MTLLNTIIRSAETVAMTACSSLEYFGENSGRFKHDSRTVPLLAGTFHDVTQPKHRLVVKLYSYMSRSHKICAAIYHSFVFRSLLLTGALTGATTGSMR